MFNPSTATAELDDPTIRRCIGFAKLWGYGRMNIVNLYAIRSTDPKAVARTVDPEGPMNDFWITRAAQESREIICAWGCAQHVPSVNARVKRVIDLIELEAFSVQLNCLGYRKDGHPRHPLMLSYKSPRQQFFWRAA
jgi:hypothetical protein